MASTVTKKSTLMIALQEALANAVLHGCGDDPAKQVHCIVSVDPAEINIVLRDPGPGFETASSSDSADDGTNLTSARPRHSPDAQPDGRDPL